MAKPWAVSAEQLPHEWEYLQIFIPKFGNIFNFCRIFAIYITVLTISRSVIWRKVIWEDGRKYANFMLILTIWSKKCKKNLSNPKFFSTFANAKVFASKAQSVTGRTS